MEEALRFSEAVHQYIRENIRAADQKAAFLFAVASGLLVFLYDHKVASEWLKAPTTWSFPDGVAFFASIGLAVAVTAAMAVVVPRRRGSYRGFIFWEAVARFDGADSYAQQLVALTVDRLAEERARHCYELAWVCSRKYGVLNAGIWSGGVGVIATLVYLLGGLAHGSV